jgi:type IV pilus assembly protein PilM
VPDAPDVDRPTPLPAPAEPKLPPAAAAPPLSAPRSVVPPARTPAPADDVVAWVPSVPVPPVPEASEEATVVLPPASVLQVAPERPEPPAEPPAPASTPEAEAAPDKAKKSRRLRRPKGEKRERGHRRAKKVVGIKIGASQIAAARVSNNGSVELHQIAREPLEAGIVVAGELRDPDALAVALKKFFKKHKLPKRGIRLGISNNRIGVRVFDIGGVESADQLRNAVRFRAQEALPISVDEAVLDYHVVGDSLDAEGMPAKRVVLVVAYRDLIDRYVGAFRKAGLKLLGVDLEAFALLRALGGEPGEAVVDGNRTGLVVVSVGHDRSTFAVSDGRVCAFTRVLDWGGSTIDAAVARTLDVTQSEAEAIKLRLSLADASVVPANLEPEQAELARDAMRRSLEAFARDLVSSLRFYQNQAESLAIRELVISGGTAELPGLADELQRLLDVRVRVGDPLGRVKVAKRVKQRDNLGSLAAAIGLGIED